MAIQDFDEYQRLAIRTMKEDTYLMKVAHCIMGMVGEAGELLELKSHESDKVIGEVGDCMWYLANLLYLLDAKMSLVLPSTKPRILAANWELVFTAARLTDMVKKSVFYGKELEPVKLLTLATEYATALASICQNTSVNMFYAAEVNIRKLEKRYPDLRFNADHAINRDYAAESKAAGVQVARSSTCTIIISWYFWC